MTKTVAGTAVGEPINGTIEIGGPEQFHLDELIRRGSTDYIEADLRDPDKILDGAAATLDFGQPVALMLLGVVNFIVDDTQAHAIVDRLVGALPSGSYLAMAHPTHEVDRDKAEQVTRTWNQRGGAPIRVRGRQELASFFDGLELLEPGVVSASQWRPDPANRDPIVAVATYCAVGRKPQHSSRRS